MLHYELRSAIFAQTECYGALETVIEYMIVLRFTITILVPLYDVYILAYMYQKKFPHCPQYPPTAVWHAQQILWRLIML